MRKLVLFGLLGGVFGLALLLEHFVTRPTVRVANDSDQLALVIGGGPARELPPEIPPTPPADPGANGGRRADPRPAPRPADDSQRGGSDALAKSRKPAPPPAPPDAAAVREHVVENGETLASIAKAELGSATRWKDLAKWNGIDDPQRVKIGTRLGLAAAEDAAKPLSAPPKQDPPPATTERTYKIAKGDTLSRIAALQLGDAKRWREIQRLNPGADPANLTEGATLQLPPR